MTNVKRISVKKINQAACILSNFNFKDVSYCHLEYIIATEDGGVIRRSFNSSDEERFMEWGKKEWRERILDSARWLRGYVASIVITFHTKDQNIVLDPLLTIEMTDLSSGLFDRLIIHSSTSFTLGEAYYTIKESSRIRGARDVVKLTRKIPRVRINKISLPYFPKVLSAAKYIR